MRDYNRWQQNQDGSWSRRPLSGSVPAATPGALEAADEYGIDLTTISGTGKDGKITKADVEATLQED